MKYKKLTPEQIKISLDRLTRFKFTREKYLRVFSDIILSNLIEPKIKKNELLNYPAEKIKKIAEEIFNNSLENPISGDYSINLRLAEYENSIFKNDTDTQCLLENRLNYHEAVKSIEEDCCVNLKWLKN
ncbi:TPA: hypothetical protein CPT97_05895, partial [Candidatus Gastranaerophilales bacterium HUM_17]